VSRRSLINILKYVLGVGLLAWVVWVNWEPQDGSPGLASALSKDVNVLPLLLAGSICLASILLTFVRWYVLVRAQDLPFTLSGAVRLGFIGYYMNTFLPFSGGDVIKAACLARQQSRRTVAVATVLLDRAIGLCGLVWLVATLGGVFWASGLLEQLVVAPTAVIALQTVTLGALALAGASLVFWVLLGVLSISAAGRFAARLERFPKVGPAFAELWRAVWMYRCRGRSIALALSMAVMGHVGFVLTFYLASLTLTAPDRIPPLGTHFLLVPVGMVIQSGFPTPGGVGGGEWGFGKLYVIAGCAAAGGVLASLVQRAITWILGLAGYLVYLRMRPRLRPATVELASPVEVATPECAMQPLRSGVAD